MKSKVLALGRMPSATGILLRDLRTMIQQARQDVARRLDSTLVTLYWNIGQRIRQDILKKKLAEYGKEIVSAVGRLLSADFGQEFGGRTSYYHFLDLTDPQRPANASQFRRCLF